MQFNSANMANSKRKLTHYKAQMLCFRYVLCTNSAVMLTANWLTSQLCFASFHLLLVMQNAAFCVWLLPFIVSHSSTQVVKVGSNCQLNEIGDHLCHVTMLWGTLLPQMCPFIAVVARLDSLYRALAQLIYFVHSNGWRWHKATNTDIYISLFVNTVPQKP